MERLLQTLLLSMATLIGGRVSTSAQTRVNANELFVDECLQFGDGSVEKNDGMVIMNDSWRLYGWYNSSWKTTDLSDYTKITAVITDYKSRAERPTTNPDIVLLVNLFKSEDAISGGNETSRVTIANSGETTIELDLAELCPYRSRVCFVGVETWEKSQFKVKEFFLTKSESAATPDIAATAEAVETTYISLTGSQSPTPHKGVNIVRRLMSDGSVRFTKAVLK